MTRAASRHGQRGVALALVIWFVAAMSLLAAGIVLHARGDVRATQLHLARAKVIAAGDGAIQLAMVQHLSGQAERGEGPLVSRTRQRLGEVAVDVTVIPAAGFVDLNSAPAELMAALFHLAGGMAPGEAQTVADNVVKWRDNDDGQARPGARERRRAQRRFHSLEDTLQVQGVNRQLLDGIRDYALAASWARGTINWNASPQQLMDVLEAVNPAAAEAVARRRDTLMQAEGNRRNRITSDGVYRVDAVVNYGGRTWLRRRWIKDSSTPGSSLPWRAVRTEAPRVIDTRSMMGTGDV